MLLRAGMPVVLRPRGDLDPADADSEVGGVVLIRLLRFHRSPDAGLPDCICSLCQQPFAAERPLEEESDPFPIRMFSDEDYELRFHVECFNRVFFYNKGTDRFDVLPDIRLEFAWGDEPLKPDNDDAMPTIVDPTIPPGEDWRMY